MHFVAHCEKYPSFRFGVPKLRDAFLKRGLTQRSTTVAFTDCTLDTESLDLTAQEAQCVKEQLKKMTAYPPRFGADIRIIQPVKKKELIQ